MTDTLSTTDEAHQERPLLRLLVLSALMGLASVSIDIYLPALPTLGVALGASQTLVQWTISGFLLGFALGQLIWGPLSDRFGRRLPAAVGLALFIAGSLGCALSGSVWQLMGWRLIQALGAASGPVIARAMVHDIHGPQNSARVLSTLMLVMGIAPLVGPLLGGQILVVSSWRAIFWTVCGFGMLALVGVLTLQETMAPGRRNVRALTGIFRGYGELLRNRALMAYALAGALFYAGIFANVAGSPFAYIAYYGVSAQAYGPLFGVNIVGLLLANLLNVRLVRRLGSDRIFRFGAGLAALSGTALLLDARFNWLGLVGLVVPLFFYVASLGFISANSVAEALAAAPGRAGAVSALVGAMQFGAGMLGSAMVGWFADGTPWTMAWVIASSGFACLIAAWLSHSTGPHAPRGA